jgi:hypothetical protein
MALIYSKVTTNTPDQSLILNSREALTYPFDVGNYQEIRMGMFFSFVSTGGPNTPYTYETIAPTSVKNRIYIGFKDSSSNFPTTSGSSFIGFSNILAPQSLGIWSTVLDPDDLSIRTVTSGAYITAGMYSFSGFNGNQVSSGNSPLYISQPMRMPTSSEVSETTNFAGFFATKLIISGDTFRYNQIYNSSLTRYSNTDIGNLRILMSGFMGESINFTGAFTGAKPNSAFIYTPFNSNVIRIHNLCVDRYS